MLDCFGAHGAPYGRFAPRLLRDPGEKMRASALSLGGPYDSAISTDSDAVKLD